MFSLPVVTKVEADGAGPQAGGEIDPGINVTLPSPIESLEKVNISNVRSVEDRGQMLTEDENLVELNFTIQYRVLTAQDFLFEVRDPELTLQSAAESALRESIGTNRMDTILAGAGREKVAQDTERVLQETLDLYNAGIQVTEFTLKDVNVPLQVREAFSDVNKAREDRSSIAAWKTPNNWPRNWVPGRPP